MNMPIARALARLPTALSLLALIALWITARPVGATPVVAAGPNLAAARPSEKPVVPPAPAEPAPRASVRHGPAEPVLPAAMARYFEGHVGRRLHSLVDKPLYRPGESIWFKTWNLNVRTLDSADLEQTTVELVSPKGAAVLRKRLRTHAGSASNDFALPPEAQGASTGCARPPATDRRRSAPSSSRRTSHRA